MNRFRVLVISIVVLALVGVGGWSLVHYAGLQGSLLWTAIIGAAAWAIRSSIEQKREYQRLLAERKREHYLQFLEFIAKFLGTTGSSERANAAPNVVPNSPAVPLEDLRMWSLRLTLIGSDEVVKAWNRTRLEGVANPGQGDNLQVLRNWGRLWLAMRKDCGHLDTKLNVTDVLASFVNDIEQHRPSIDD